MIYTKTFRLSDFEWTGNAKRVVEMICKSGKSSEFVDLIKERFDHEDDTAADFEISKWVIDEVVGIMESLGLTLDGKPVKKKYKVFYRVTGVSFEEVEADNAIEAREKFMDDFFDSPGDPLFCMDRDDIETVVPVAYDEGDGDTKDYPPEEQEDHSERRQVWVLTRMDGDNGSFDLAPYVSLFSSEKEATDEMASRYRFVKSALENRGTLDMFQDPEDGIVTCYAVAKDGHEVRFHVSTTEDVNERK